VRVSRWEPNARGRLEQAALELFAEQGFADTTVPQITARAGLTTRTFFRHFSDKREVLFSYEEQLPGVIATLMSEAPAHLTAMEVMDRGLGTTVASRFEGQREYLMKRQAVVLSDASLRERELRKLSILSAAIHAGFLERGLSDLDATIAAQVGVTVFDVAVTRWLAQDSGRALPELFHETLEAVRNLTSAASAAPQAPATAPS